MTGSNTGQYAECQDKQDHGYTLFFNHEPSTAFSMVRQVFGMLITELINIRYCKGQ